MLDLWVKSTGRINSSQVINGSMFTGVDIIGGAAPAVVTVYDGGSNTGNILFQGSNSTSRDTVELSYPVAGQGRLWIEISGTQANCVVRYR